MTGRLNNNNIIFEYLAKKKKKRRRIFSCIVTETPGAVILSSVRIAPAQVTVLERPH